PEEMVKTLNEYFEMMVDVLFAHGGTLDKYVGDEVIGLFGAPVALPDAPLRAVRCGLEMQRALEEFNRIRVTNGQEPIHIGIGINTGPVIAGAIGSSRTLQYTVIGDPVNIASRLCSVARAGEVIVSQYTMRAVQSDVVLEPREPVRVKGKSPALQILCAPGLPREPASPRSTLARTASASLRAGLPGSNPASTSSASSAMACAAAWCPCPARAIASACRACACSSGSSRPPLPTSRSTTSRARACSQRPWAASARPSSRLADVRVPSDSDESSASGATSASASAARPSSNPTSARPSASLLDRKR